MTGIEPELLLLLGAATIAGGALAFFTGLLLFGAQRRTQQRLTALSARWQRNGAGEGDPAAPRLRRRQADSSLPLLDAIIKRVMPRPQMLRERLARTGRSISIAKYLTWSLIFGLVMTGAGIFAFDFPLVPSLLGGIVATFGVAPGQRDGPLRLQKWLSNSGTTSACAHHFRIGWERRAAVRANSPANLAGTQGI